MGNGALEADVPVEAAVREQAMDTGRTTIVYITPKNPLIGWVKTLISTDTKFGQPAIPTWRRDLLDGVTK